MFRALFLAAALLLPASAGLADEALDLTLIFGADVEIGMSGRSMTDQIARNHALAMRNLVGTDGQRLRWPDGTSGAGTDVGKPSAIFIAGDLALDNSIREGSESWKLLELLYGSAEPLAGAPTYLGWGNHDAYAHNWWFTPAGADNNNSSHALIRRQKADVVSTYDQDFGPFSSTPPHYAVRKGRLLVLQLNTSLGEPCRRSNMIGIGRWDGGIYAESGDASCAAHQWLRDTLAAHKQAYGDKAPVVVVQHYGYDDFGLSGGGYRGYWWHPDARADLAQILKDTNVIAFFHGHKHHDVFTAKGTRVDGQPVFSTQDLTSPKLDVGYASGGRAWADFDGDGDLDFCRVTDSNGAQGRVRCRLNDGLSFGTDVVSPTLDAGYSEGRSWVDVDGDGKADYCRVTDSNSGNGKIRCRRSTGSGFAPTDLEASLDVGYTAGRSWADFDGDGRADYCRVVGSDSGQGRVRCMLSTGTGFGQDVESGSLDVGYWEGRAFVDVDGDRRADYCRVVDANQGQGKVRCTLSAGNAFGGGFDVALDVGYGEGRTWADFDGDGKADYCRVTDANEALGVIRCRRSLGTSFAGQDITSATDDITKLGLDVGYTSGRTWADFNADGKADYCRVLQGDRAECSISTGAGFPFDASIRSLPLDDTGYDRSRAWVDVNGDRRVDFCRVVDSEEGQGRVRCTFGAVASTVVPFDSYGVASGYCPGSNFTGGFTVVRVTDDRLDVVPVHKTATHCADAQYDGSVTVNQGLVRSVPIQTR